MHLAVQNVRKNYETESEILEILQGVQLTAENGDFISIMGPSGSGKSTFLFLLALLDYPTSGSILMDDADVSMQDEIHRERIRLHQIGFIFQNFNLLPVLTALDNVLLPMQLAGKFRGEQAERGMKLLRLLGIEEKARLRSSALSGGDQQRVSIARALANMPSLLLADEPTGNLDVKTGREIMEALRSINQKQNITLIVATHDPKVAAYADRIFYLDSGKLRGTAL